MSVTMDLRPNRYAKKCVSCGLPVAIGAGYLVPRNTPEGGWDVICQFDAQDSASKPEMKAAVVATAKFRTVQDRFPIEVPASDKPHQIAVQSSTGQTYRGVAPGTYTVHYPDGHYRTFRVRVQESDAKFAPGKAVLEYLHGPSNEADYEGFAFIESGFRLRIWKRFRQTSPASLLDDAEQFARHPEWATLAANCIRCNALLTTPTSVAAGIGPTCIQKGW